MTFATKMRTLIMSLIEEGIDKKRPRPRYGKVYSIDRANSRCQVILTGDEDPVTVTMGAIQPSSVDQIVRVEGIGVDKYITDVIGGDVYIDAGLVDKLYTNPNYTYVLGRAGNFGTGDGNTVLLVDAGNGNIGGIVDNNWRWRFNTSGVLNVGTVPVERLSGRAPFLAHIAANANATPPYAIFGAVPDNTYSSNTTSLRLQNNSGATTGERYAIYDASRKVLLVGTADSAGDYTAMLSAYTRTTTAAANMVAFTTAGAIGRSTSLRSAKLSIEDAPESWVDKIWNLRPRTWFDRSDAELVAEAMGSEEEVDWSQVAAGALRRIPGFVAEEVEEAGLEEFLIRDEEGNLTGLAYDRFPAALFMAMKSERKRADDLQLRVDALEGRIAALEARLGGE